MRTRMVLGCPAGRSRLGVTALAVAVIACLGGAAPVVAQSVAAPASGGTGGPPPPGGGPQYWRTVDSNISITGDTLPGQSVAYPLSLPPCWLEARYAAADSWQKGDPGAMLPPPLSAGDADKFWWSFANTYPGFYPIPVHDPGAVNAINKVFRDVQQNPGGQSWWVPAWLSGPAGEQCAISLVAGLGLNNGFLDLTKPGATPPGGLTGRMLADLARAALALPRIRLHTNPPVGHPSDVNLPVWVWATYTGEPMAPRDQASVPLPGGGALTATVRAGTPTLSLSVSDPGHATVYNHCGATGTPYPGNPTATPPCGVTFLAPSTAGPYTLTVTATWTVTWTDNQGGGGGFRTPPWPRAQRTIVDHVTVREIQAVNNG